MKKRIISIVSVILVVAMLSVVLVACANADSYQKKLEKAGYTVQVAEGKDANEGQEDENTVKWVVFGEKKGDGLLNVDMVTVVCFNKSEDAEKAYKDAFDAAKAAVGEDKAKNMVVRSGKIVISGTEAGVKAAK